MKPHKHAELIKAWADGAVIQVRNIAFDEWHDQDHPWWDDEDYQYRIKPEPKPDVVMGATASIMCIRYEIEQANLKLTFDGETGELKSAEVLK